jgi:hypothetical protein
MYKDPRSIQRHVECPSKEQILEEGESLSPTYSKAPNQEGEKSLKLLEGIESDAQGKEEKKEREREA